MTALRRDEPRHLIPRWRPLEKSVVLGELWYPQTRDRPDLNRGLAQLENDWHTHETLAYACDFAASAIISGQPEKALGVRSTLSESGGVFSLVADTLDRPDTAWQDLDPTLGTTLRDTLRRDLRNPIRWLDLAHIQFCHGHIDAAEKSIKVAVQLAPSNRYILRAVSTFYVAIGEPERALHIVRPIASELRDPWLVSTEIAISCVSDGRSRLIRKGRNLLQQEVWSPRSVSELASEIGTIELGEGRTKKSRSLFQTSLLDPTDNAVAQAVSIATGGPETWLSELVESASQLHSHAAEALAYRSEYESDFASALSYAIEWLEDQPFSPRAVHYASYMASTGVQDWAMGAELARRGLKVHPRDTVLRNNLAYALIELGLLDDARSQLDAALQQSSAEDFDAVLTATRGLLAYRAGRANEGRIFYESAARIARHKGHDRVEAISLCFHARECGDSELGRTLLRRAARLIPSWDKIGVAVLERAEGNLANPS